MWTISQIFALGTSAPFIARFFWHSFKKTFPLLIILLATRPKPRFGLARVVSLNPRLSPDNQNPQSRCQPCTIEFLRKADLPWGCSQILRGTQFEDLKTEDSWLPEKSPLREFPAYAQSRMMSVC